MKIVIALPLTEAQKQSFLDASQGNEIVFKDCGDVSGSVLTLGAITEEDVKDADAIIGNAPLKVVRQASKLKWMQLSSAGSDAYDKPNALPNNALLTAASGAYGVAVSEHLLACILSLKKGLHLYRDNMTNKVWRDEGHITSIVGSVSLILGTGDIGTELAFRLKALGGTVYGVRRSASVPKEPFDKIFSINDIPAILPQVDILASVMPGDPSLTNLIGKAEFAAMKDSAIFVNAGRGNIVDQDALCEALTTGEIFGAAIDVAVKEPLPQDDPLWNCRNLIITPHVAGQFHLQLTVDKIAAIALENMKRWLNGEDLVNVRNR